MTARYLSAVPSELTEISANGAAEIDLNCWFPRGFAGRN